MILQCWPLKYKHIQTAGSCGLAGRVVVQWWEGWWVISDPHSLCAEVTMGKIPNPKLCLVLHARVNGEQVHVARCKKVTHITASQHLHRRQPQRLVQYSVVVYCKGAEESKKKETFLGKKRKRKEWTSDEIDRSTSSTSIYSLERANTQERMPSLSSWCWSRKWSFIISVPLDTVFCCTYLLMLCVHFLVYVGVSLSINACVLLSMGWGESNSDLYLWQLCWRELHSRTAGGPR